MDASTLEKLHRLRQMAEEMASVLSQIDAEAQLGLNLAHVYAHTLADEIGRVEGRTDTAGLNDEAHTRDCGCRRNPNEWSDANAA